MERIGLTREDFIKYKHYFFKMLERTGIQDEELENNKKEKSVNQKHDKSFKDILADKKEMSKFLEQFIEIEVKSEELEEQKTLI